MNDLVTVGSHDRGRQRRPLGRACVPIPAGGVPVQPAHRLRPAQQDHIDASLAHRPARLARRTAATAAAIITGAVTERAKGTPPRNEIAEYKHRRIAWLTRSDQPVVSTALALVAAVRASWPQAAGYKPRCELPAARCPDQHAAASNGAVAPALH
jgi:hypothetical protein